MPVQTQMSSFAKKLGNRVAAANAEHSSKPVEVGMQSLPPGIRNAVAKLQVMTTKEQTKEDGKVPKGEIFFMGQAVVMYPESFNGEKIAGRHTFCRIPLCDIPAKGLRKAKSFSDNFFEFQNLFKLLGVAPCPETPQTDPTGQRTEAYFFAAMKTLTSPQRPPVYISFSTRGWSPPATMQNPNPSTMVIEEWHGLADVSQMNGVTTPNPLSAVVVASGTSQPDPTDAPPVGADGLPNLSSSSIRQPTNTEIHSPESNTADEAEVAELLEVAMNDPSGDTEEGKLAHSRLYELALSAGWSEEQIGEASWTEVSHMALNPATEGEQSQYAVTTGSKFMFAKRDRNGNKLKNSKGEDFAPQEVEVTSVEYESQTCTVKYVKDGKDVLAIGTKKPLSVKFDWLE